MKKHFYLIAALIIMSTLYDVKASYAQSVNDIVFKQIPLPGIAKIPVIVSAKIYTYPHNTAKGIRATILIKNDSSNVITLENPLYNVRLNLLNSKGVDIVFPNKNFAPIHSTEQGREIPKSFSVNSIKINGNTIPETGKYQSRIVLPPHGTIELDISLNRVLRSNANKPYSYDETDILSNGEYRFKVSQEIQLYQSKSSSLFGCNFINVRVDSQD